MEIFYAFAMGKYSKIDRTFLFAMAGEYIWPPELASDGF
jgi:hypothetical protein